jgi:HTH-type transcriptional regulator, pleiotropic regulator of extracellular virulence genes
MTQSKLNLATAFDENSRDYFVNPKDARSQIEAQKKQLAATSDPFEQMALYGRIGGSLRILKDLDQAEQFLDEALALIDKHSFGKNHWAQQSIRRAHVAHWKGEFEKAEAILHEVWSECRSSEECKSYEHFALQHLGKCFLDKNEIQTALKFFEAALAIRKTMGDPQLIKSTEDAIQTAQRKLNQR